jgi:DNA-binding SARP family transcriptional activator
VAAPSVEILVLGPLEARIGGVAVRLGGPRQRAVLGVLALDPGVVVSVDRVIEGVWGDAPPTTARHLVQVYVSQLRATLGVDDVLVSRPPGYVLATGHDAVDASRFRAIVARSAGAPPAERLRLLDEACGLWRGRVLADVSLEGAPGLEVARLEELRLSSMEDRADAALAAGRHGDLVPQLEQLARAEPLRERTWELLMLALYRAGRQADALAAYREVRNTLVDTLGIEPGPGLRHLQQAILNQDTALAAPRKSPGGRPAPSARTRRRLAGGAAAVAVCVCAVALGSTRGGATTAASLPAHSVGVLDAASARLLGHAVVGGVPGPIAVEAGSGWVGNAADRTIEEIDARTFHVLRTVGVGTVPFRLALTGGSVWVASGFDGTLVRFDETSGVLSRGVRFDSGAAGALALAATPSTLWVGSQDGVVVETDPETGAVRIAGRAAGVNDAVAAFGSLFVANRRNVVLTRLDGRRRGPTATIPVGDFALAVAATDRNVWVLTPATGRVRRIDPVTNSVTAIVRVGAGGVALAATGHFVWVGLEAPPRLVEIDTRTLRVVRRLRLSHPLGGLAAAGGRVWISLR